MTDLQEIARETADETVGIREKAEALLPELEAGAAEADDRDRFVAENYARLRAAGLVEAGVPRELGGGGAEVAELAEMLRILAHGCSSTALAFASNEAFMTGLLGD